MRRTYILFGIFALALCAFPFRAQLRRPFVAVIQRVKGRKTVADRVEQYGQAVRERLAPDFERVSIAYPAEKLVFVGLKQDKLLEVWVSNKDGKLKLLKSYPVLGASGILGPKLQEGDAQVPEGVYRIESLNPNSMFHLSLRVNYPNAFDREKGKKDERSDLGGDIMIHGSNCSVGCLAMGDEAAEDLFVLAAECGIDNVSVILSPVDFRKEELPEDMPKVPEWTGELYELIKVELNRLK